MTRRAPAPLPEFSFRPAAALLRLAFAAPFVLASTAGLAQSSLPNGLTVLGNDYTPTAMSADGTIFVVNAQSPYSPTPTGAEPFRWTQAGGLVVSLGTLNGGNFSSAYGISADGEVIVGGAADGAAGNAHRAFRWTQAGGMVSLGTLNGGDSSSAHGISADGEVIVGRAHNGTEGNATHAFRWTQAGGMVSLGTLNGGTYSSASDVSADGKVVVGMADDGATGNAYHTFRAFRWTQAGGLQTVEAWLRANRVVLPAGVSTWRATATNGDGSVVVGVLDSNTFDPIRGQNIPGNAFIARVSPTGSGLVTLAEVQTSLGAAATGGSMVLAAAGTVLGGAHSQPLMRRVGTGQKTVWVAGDWGRDDHGQRNGSLGLAEIGGGWNLGAAQFNLSAGQTWARQSMALGGRAAIDGNYLLAEALVPVRGDLWATFGGYGHWGKSDLKRAYLNAGTQTASKGTPEVDTWGVRARLDWENAATLAGTRLTPYADLTYAQTRLEGYTETGGGFPARFDARRDRSTELRLGANANKPVGGNLNLVGTLEATHRFERNGSRTVGEVIGLFGFDLPGQRYKQDWLRTGVGVETKIGGGTGSLSLNATTRGEALNMWLAANWQMAF